MWLDKYLFCGSSCCPNANYLFLAKCLARGGDIPLGQVPTRISIFLDEPSISETDEERADLHNEWTLVASDIVAKPIYAQGCS